MIFASLLTPPPARNLAQGCRRNPAVAVETISHCDPRCPPEALSGLYGELKPPGGEGYVLKGTAR